MSTIVPAFKAQMGNTQYYVSTMSCHELVKHVVIPSETAEWDEYTLEDRFQRIINFKRVNDHIAPYLKSASRFFGAFVLMVENHDGQGPGLTFEPVRNLENNHSGFDNADTGLLTIAGTAKWLPLDGQHRVVALKVALTGKDENNKRISNIVPDRELRQEHVSVIFISHNEKKARSLFTDLNRYARSTSKGQNIVTDDYDIAAVVCRWIVNKEIGSRVIEIDAPSLKASAREWTTLTTVYAIQKAIIASLPEGKKIDDLEEESGDDESAKIERTELIEKIKSKSRKVWRIVLRKIHCFSEALEDTGSKGDTKRIRIRKQNLLGRPAGQLSLCKAFIELTSAPTSLSPNEACERLNLLPWAIKNTKFRDVWQHILWQGGKRDGKMLSRDANTKHATHLISYMCGSKSFEDNQKLESFRKEYRRMSGRELTDAIVAFRKSYTTEGTK